MVTANDSMLTLRIPTDLHERIRDAASERNLSATFLVTRAVEEFLDRLIPADELRLTRDQP